MNENNFEIIKIGGAHLTVDVSAINSESMFFNATQMAKEFNKRPDDFWKQQQNQDYLEAFITLYGGDMKSYVKTRRGRYSGTWLHNDLGLAFARWLSPFFAVQLDQWPKKRLEEEKKRQCASFEARTGYLPMTVAVLEAHPPLRKYHYTNEANLINRMVLGMPARKFKETNKVKTVRDSLSTAQLFWIEKLQRVNTGLIELGLEYSARKDMLCDLYVGKIAIVA
ncbi:KilA-N domain-containing protein [Desulfosediminicola flagellatus]|uniref:KilA-N domain-containing protein n=1 Tax=Desulfosediminicola flagellatus TaxID=2569541 RepID=UPI0010ABF6A5|nr:KilA-N domain-containing protein [Desulfosediminicola flagellatus]